MNGFRAGQRIKASDLNAIIADTAYLIGDVSRTSTTGLAAVGLELPVAAGAMYAIEAYLPYLAAAAGDLKVALVGPAGATGHWGLSGLASTATDQVGDTVGSRVDVLTTAGSIVAGGAGTTPVFAFLRGFAQIGSTAGVLGVYTGQGTSSATPSVLKAGAVLRLGRIS